MADEDLWSAVEELAARTRLEADLELHGLLAIAAACARRDGAALPPSLARLERSAAVKAMAAPRLLARVRASLAGDAILLKGFEVAQYYPQVLLRPFNDIDLLVRDAGRAERALLASGCEYVGPPDTFDDLHHGRPLAYPDAPIWIEVHHELKWPARLPRPDADELFAMAVPSRTGVPGILALPPAAHALAIAAHAWAHAPLGTVRALLDIALLTADGGAAETAELARQWGIPRLWRTTSGCLESLFYGSRRTAAERLWARHLDPPRDRTLVEQHLSQWLSPLWASRLSDSAPAAAALLLAEFLPRHGESWASKVSRAPRAFASGWSRSTDYARRASTRP